MGFNFLGFIIAAGLVLTIIIASIILIATKACKRCRWVDPEFVFDPEVKALADQYIGDFSEEPNA